MASVVDICNLALSHLGDDATVTDINPPEGSAQAEHCQRFYPIARDKLLEMHPWGFATRRAVGASLDVPTGAGWGYAYTFPNNALSIVAVLPLEAQDDYSASAALNVPGYSSYGNVSSPYIGLNLDTLYTPQDFAIETNSDGTKIILTNQPQAVIRYTVKVTDPAKFSPLFVNALAYLLASYLAGPVIKGDAGRAEAKGNYQLFLATLADAKVSDTNQQQIRPTHRVPWFADR